MSEWTYAKLTEIAIPGKENFIDGDWIEAPHITEEGIRLIQTGNIGVGTLKNKNKKYISEKSFRELRCKEVYPGDVLICRLAEPAGRSCVVPNLREKKYITSVDVTIFRVNEELYDKYFVVHSINTQEFLDLCQEKAGGTTRTRISRSNLGGIAILCPPLPQQKKIAKILTTIDNLIEQTQALIDKYTAIKQGMMADLFTRGIDLSGTPETNPNHGQLRSAYEDAPELYKETELGWVPKEWDVVSLGEISEKITSGSRDWASYYAESGDVFVRISNLTREHINFRWDSIKYVDIGGGSEGDRTRLIEGDVLISITADLGIIGVVPKNLGVAYINQHTALVRLNSLNNPRFIGIYLSSFSGQMQFAKYNDSGAKAGLNLPTISNLKCVRPSVAEQSLISRVIDSIDSQIAHYKLECSKYEKQKKGLMQGLLSGKVQMNTE